LFSDLSAMVDRGATAGSYILIAPEVTLTLKDRGSVVALESAVITHGLPHPRNIELARDLERAVRDGGATPATVAVLDGTIRVGLSDRELARLAESKSKLKIGPRDLTTAIVQKSSGGTTAAATMFAASGAGIQVFATGGIGGVHRENSFDVSADLRALADIPMIVVCAGAKAVLDLPATLEYLETLCVPVIGYGTGEFPAFYSRDSGLPASLRLDSPHAIAEYWRIHQSLGLPGSMLVANPIPETDEIPRSDMEPIIARASQEARDRKIHGQALTPFLLERVRELSAGRSVRANEALLLNNARLAAKIANAIVIHEV
jgi:pseudouridine-5'-phosphate glycosidase